MKRVITSLLAIATMVSCAKEESTPVESGSVAQFSTESVVTRMATSTSASSASTWEVGDLIGISNTVFDYVNVQYKVSAIGNDGKVTFTCVNEEEQIILPRNKEVKYVAYYPYQNIITDNYHYISDVSDQNDLSAIDFIVATDSVAGMEDTATEVTFTFKHALAMVQFNFSLGEDMKAVYTDFSDHTPSIVISGAYTTYAYSHLGDDASFFCSSYIATGNISVPVAASDTKPTATAIVNPIGEAHSVTLLCTFDTHVYEYTLATFKPTASTISNYDITLGFDEITVSNDPSITAWVYANEGNTEDLGTLTETTETN